MANVIFKTSTNKTIDDLFNWNKNTGVINPNPSVPIVPGTIYFTSDEHIVFDTTNNDNQNVRLWMGKNTATATNADKIDGYHSLGGTNPSHFYAYSSIFENDPKETPTEDWYVKIILDRRYDANLTNVTIVANYSNIQGKLYLDLDSSEKLWKGYLTTYQYSNILAIKRGHETLVESGESKAHYNVIYVKLKKPIAYNGTVPPGTITIYSPVAIKSIERITLNDIPSLDVEPLIPLKSGYNSNTSITIQNTSESQGVSSERPPLQIGDPLNKHLVFGTDEIMARDNSGASTLYLNNEGGAVQIGNGGLKTGNIIIGGSTDVLSKTVSSASTLYLNSATSCSILFQNNNTEIARFDQANNFAFIPNADAGRGLGLSNRKWASLYTTKLQVPASGTITASLPLHLTNTTAATATLLSSQLIIGNSKNAPALELYRTESNSASWQLINDTGTFKIKNNYKNDIAGDYDDDSAFAISWKTGHVTVGGDIYPRTAGDKNLGSNTTQWNNIYANWYYIKSGSNSYNSITSNAETNIYFNIKNGNSSIIPLVITNTEVRRGTSASTINLGSSAYKWANVYATNFKGNADTATSAGRWTTARTITKAGDLQGEFSISGSGNVIDRAYLSYLQANRKNSNTIYCYHRILKAGEITTNHYNSSAILILNQGMIDGKYGIARVIIRTNDITKQQDPIVQITWLVRKGFAVDALQYGLVNNSGKLTADIYLKETGAYGHTLIRVLQDYSGNVDQTGDRITKVNSSAVGSGASGTNTTNNEVYSQLNITTAISIDGVSRTYTKVGEAIDSGIVNKSLISDLATKAFAANITSTTNAIAYYTNTTGTFGSKASANGALYATSANGTLNWGTLPVAQGGTGQTTLPTGEALIGNAQGGITTRQILNNTGAQDIGWSDNNTSIKLVNQNSIAYWNGAYNSGTGSNLRYFSDAYFNSNAFIPRTTGTYNLGTSSYKWNQIYLNSIQFRGSSYTTDNYITSNAQNNIFFSVGGINSLVVENTDLRPGSGRNITLGTSSNKWYGLYTNSLQVPNSGTITSSLPIQITHASGGQKELQIVYGNNIDFSLMVGTANSNHGLYDNKKGTNGTWILSADSTNHNWSFNGNASTATALQTAIIETSVVGSGLSHTNVIKNYYQSNASIPKEKLLSFYSNAYSGYGAQYLGYYIPEGTYGSFIALHYNDNPKFIGINQGNYYERTILTDDGAGNFLPAASNAYNLGSSDYQWNALYMNKFQVPSTGIIQANLPIHINGGFSADSAPGFKQSSLVIYQPNKNYPAIELCRHDTSSETSKKASWQLINENGTFKIKNNWGKVSSTATTRTENSTYTETLLSINPGTEALTNGTDPVFTAYAPIKVVHASGKQKEVEITYGSNIDFSLMVETGNVNHGLYDSKIGSTGAWVLNTDSSHEWMFTGKKVYLAGSINANTALNSSQLVLSAVENETSGKALGIEMCYTGSDVINNSSGKQRQSWQILNDLGTLKIRTNGDGSQYESGYVETPIQIDRYSLTSITRLKPKSVEGTFYYENSNKFTIANNGSSYKKILLSKNGNNSAIFSNPPTENGLYIISVLLLIRVPSISTNDTFYAAGLGVLPWASIYSGIYDWIDITSEGFGDSHISIKLDYRNGDTILSVETKSSSYLGGRSIEIGPKGCQIHMIKIGNHFPTVDDVYPSE